jgi:hypothetical protein
MQGTSRKPRLAMEIIVESAVLYTISALVYTAILSSEVTLTSADNTYDLYANLFFYYMAVASIPSWILVFVF